jgi:hypothetical protein
MSELQTAYGNHGFNGLGENGEVLQCLGSVIMENVGLNRYIMQFSIFCGQPFHGLWKGLGDEIAL